MTEQELRRRFDILIEKHGGSFRAAAKKLGYSEPFLSMCASGKRPIPDPLLLAMGVKRQIQYVEVQC
jgi:hypothetical protein